MSATTHDDVDIDTTRPGIPLARLVRVELRKAFDTRAGFWYCLAILILSALVLAFFVSFVPDELLSLSTGLSVSGGVLGYFLPIIPILLVTSEWGQRTGLITFTFEPRRGRVVEAKFAAGVIVAVGVLVLSLGMSAVALGIASPFRTAPVDWSFDGQILFNVVLSNLIGVFIGFALAMLIKNTPAAIVGYFVYSLVIPAVVGIVSQLVGWFDDLAPWIEFNRAQQPLFTGDNSLSGQEWAQFATAGLIWLVLPLVLGTLSLLRSEVK